MEVGILRPGFRLPAYVPSPLSLPPDSTDNTAANVDPSLLLGLLGIVFDINHFF